MTGVKLFTPLSSQNHYVILLSVWYDVGTLLKENNNA